MALRSDEPPPALSLRHSADLTTMPKQRIVFITLALLGAACVSGCSEEPQGEARRLVQEVCLGYDDLRGRNVIRLENDPEIQQIHQRANEVCDLVDDGRAAAEAAESDTG